MAATADAGALPQVGIPLGILIGVLSGALSLLFLRTLQHVRRDSSQVLPLTAEFVGIPGMWLGTPFGSDLLAGLDLQRILTSYVISLAAVYVLIMSWPLIRLIIATGNEIDSDD